MTRLKICSSKYAFDKGLNLIQKNSSEENRFRMVATAQSNRAINQQLYQSLNLNPVEKANLKATLIAKGIFDLHGNKIKSVEGNKFVWDFQNMLQSTITILSDGETFNEYNSYIKAGNRNRKVTQEKDKQGNINKITEILYLGDLNYHTVWIGNHLSYDGETVTEQNTGVIVNPSQKYTTLRFRQGHRQVAKKLEDKLKAKASDPENTTTFCLSNNIDSCELTLNHRDYLESYESYRPYGRTSVSYGRVEQQHYKYSGQEKDRLHYYYGFRSLDPDQFRWLSPDPTGLLGSGFNWYAMVHGNPVTSRDSNGLVSTTDLTAEATKMVIHGFLIENFRWHHKYPREVNQMTSVMSSLLYHPATKKEREALVKFKENFKKYQQYGDEYLAHLLGKRYQRHLVIIPLYTGRYFNESKARRNQIDLKIPNIIKRQNNRWEQISLLQHHLKTKHIKGFTHSIEKLLQTELDENLSIHTIRNIHSSLIEGTLDYFKLRLNNSRVANIKQGISKLKKFRECPVNLHFGGAEVGIDSKYIKTVAQHLATSFSQVRKQRNYLKDSNYIKEIHKFAVGIVMSHLFEKGNSMLGTTLITKFYYEIGLIPDLPNIRLDINHPNGSRKSFAISANILPLTRLPVEVNPFMTGKRSKL